MTVKRLQEYDRNWGLRNGKIIHAPLKYISNSKVRILRTQASVSSAKGNTKRKAGMIKLDERLLTWQYHSIISQAKVSSYGFPNETSRLNEQVRRTARITEPVTVCQRMLRLLKYHSTHEHLTTGSRVFISFIARVIY